MAGSSHCERCGRIGFKPTIPHFGNVFFDPLGPVVVCDDCVSESKRCVSCGEIFLNSLLDDMCMRCEDDREREVECKYCEGQGQFITPVWNGTDEVLRKIECPHCHGKGIGE